MPLFDINLNLKEDSESKSSPPPPPLAPPSEICYAHDNVDIDMDRMEHQSNTDNNNNNNNNNSPVPVVPTSTGKTAHAPLFAIQQEEAVPVKRKQSASPIPLFAISQPPPPPQPQPQPQIQQTNTSTKDNNSIIQKQQIQPVGELFAIPTTSTMNTSRNFTTSNSEPTATTHKQQTTAANGRSAKSLFDITSTTSSSCTTTKNPLFALSQTPPTPPTPPTPNSQSQSQSQPLSSSSPAAPEVPNESPLLLDLEQGQMMPTSSSPSTSTSPSPLCSTKNKSNTEETNDINNILSNSGCLTASSETEEDPTDDGGGGGIMAAKTPSKGSCKDHYHNHHHPSINHNNNKSDNFFKDDDDDDDYDTQSDVGVIVNTNGNNKRRGRGRGRGRNSSDDDNSSMGTGSTTSSVGSLVEALKNRTGLMVSLIVILGMGAAAAFLAVGVTGAQREQTDQFERTAMDLVTAIESQFDRYMTAANYVHHYCRNRSFTRQDFRSLYEYLIEDGLDFKAVQFDPNVTREERPQYEEEARAYYQQYYPHIKYRGFVGFDDGVENGLVPTSERDFYFPIHYMEPIIGNEAAIDLDYYSHISRRRTLSHCFEYGEPAITDRLLLVKDPNVKSRCGSQDVASYGVVLMHPGVNITDRSSSGGGIWPRDLSSIVLCIPGLLVTATQDLHVASEVYIHDAADSSGKILFLGGVAIDKNEELSYLDEIHLRDIRGDMTYHKDMELTNKVWTITVVATNDAYRPNLTFVILGGVLVLLASVCLGLWVHNNTRRTHKFNAMKAKVEGEKAALILENTRQAARAERELNDFIAHEVRNPVAAAMAACSFVKSAVNEAEPLVDPQKREDTREDVGVIYNSLQFVNDLLRNMLDMHRASHKQLQVNFETIDLYHDILQSTAGMIYQRDSKVKVIVECEPQNLHVQSDCLRLKQVILNLSRNASKFVNEGFIKLKGYVVDNEVRLAVEDSGIGIPAEKRDLLFAKFQESLDRLSQGTGIGLYLCKNLVELMGGEIFLDKNYDSGIPGNPGTSIIINLKRPPLSAEDLAHGLDGEDESSDETLLNYGGGGGSSPLSGTLDISQSSEDNALLEQALPEHLTVLFVDDDAILRKLFARSVKRVAPGWTMREASNGESALQLLDEGIQFDLIFVDQYMASIEKQLLGTETILEMRARGCDSRLFGLSANDLETEFIAAGADGFVIKPFPTETDALRHELLRAYYGKRAYYAKR